MKALSRMWTYELGPDTQCGHTKSIQRHIRYIITALAAIIRVNVVLAPESKDLDPGAVSEFDESLL